MCVVLSSFLFLGFNLSKHHRTFAELGKSIIEYRQASLITAPIPTYTPKPTQKITPTLSISGKPGTYTQKKTALPQPTDSQPWGVAQKVDDLTYTIKVGEDATMSTPQEVLEALNHYRNVNGKSSLSWNDALASYAQSRSNYFTSISGTDKHAGFDNFLNKENGFDTLGFRRLGENSYYGGKLSGVHLIEWVFAQSPGHNANQLDANWTDVGIGVTNSAVNLNFGGEKM